MSPSLFKAFKLYLNVIESLESGSQFLNGFSNTSESPSFFRVASKFRNNIVLQYVLHIYKIRLCLFLWK